MDGNSTWNGTLPLTSLVSSTEIHVWAAICLALVVVGSTLNGLTLVALLYSRAQWRSVFTLIFSLAFADFSLGALFYPAQIFNIVFGNIYLWKDYYFCQSISFLTGFLTFGSTLGCCRIALYRLLIVQGRKMEKEERKRRKFLSLGLVMGSYLCSALISCFPLGSLGSDAEYFPPFGFCNKVLPRRDWMSWSVFGLWFLAPFALIVGSYSKIFLILHQRQKRLLRVLQLSWDYSPGADSSRRTGTECVADQTARRYIRIHRLLVLRIIIPVTSHFLTHFPASLYYMTGPLLAESSASQIRTELCVLTLLYAAICTNAVRHAYGLSTEFDFSPILRIKWLPQSGAHSPTEILELYLWMVNENKSWSKTLSIVPTKTSAIANDNLPSIGKPAMESVVLGMTV